MACADSVNICWRDQAGQTHLAVADLADISSSGASFRAPRPVQIGALLSFGYQRQLMVGNVRHCLSGRRGYLLGIKFQAGRGWSPQQQPITAQDLP
jgi:hypothetical protein